MTIIDHDLLMRAVRKHTDCKWMLLYIERWLKAPVQLEDGNSDSSGERDPARRGDQSLACESVFALCV